MSTLAERFLALHTPGKPLVIPNPWDVASARILAKIGFRALATTSSGYAASVGRRDGQVSRAEALDYAARIVRATDLPVSADLERGFGAGPKEVAETYRLAARIGLAGASIEDASGEADRPLYDIPRAADRVRAAAEAAHGTVQGLVLTARAENFFHGSTDVSDVVARLQAYQEAGADVLYAPGPTDLADIRAIVSSVDRPVNVLLRPGGPGVAELAEAGVARVSVGGGPTFAVYGAFATAARELFEHGTAGYGEAARAGHEATASFGA
ncbi:MAG TPA: isocitrate lyase/phosphoenolpyruvate mutase family protein [Microbacteriaceae bacterium]|nr:isocitrate lyase/phosphoenolpyruvate mutase family protein [Microbacteriaceae bacterium]